MLFTESYLRYIWMGIVTSIPQIPQIQVYFRYKYTSDTNIPQIQVYLRYIWMGMATSAANRDNIVVHGRTALNGDR